MSTRASASEIELDPWKTQPAIERFDAFPRAAEAKGELLVAGGVYHLETGSYDPSGANPEVANARTVVTKRNVDVVEALCASLSEGGTEALLRHLSQDVAYHNVPWPVVHGHEAVKNTLSPFIDGPHCALSSMHVHHTVADGDIVMNARDETWNCGQVEVVLPVAGVFRLRDGLITHWSDYFDSKTMNPILQAMREREA